MIVMRSGGPKQKGFAVALGIFDGVHKAHQILIKTAVESGLPALVYTIDPNPKSLLPPTPVPVLTPMDIKRELISDLGASILYIEKGTRALLNMEPEAFAKEILREKLGARLVVAGYDYRFGKGGAGTAHDLAALGRTYGFDTVILDRVMVDGETVSSTALREALKTGDMGKIHRFCGRFHKICGKVISGKQLGRTLGIPTANMAVDPQIAVPKNGVYAVIAEIGGVRYPAVANVGINPTVGGNVLHIETHIINYSVNAYGERLCLEFVERLRDETRFPSVIELKEQITKDILRATALLKPYLDNN